jgi:hypothetical protein
MENKEILEFIQEVNKPLSFRLSFHIPHRNNITYQAEVDAMELAFEMSISDNLIADSSYINQLPEIKERLNNILSKLQRRRYRYEAAANTYKDRLPAPAPNQKLTRDEQRDKANLQHLRNIIAQFKLALEPNIKKAIKYIDKKLKEQEEKETIVVVEVEKVETTCPPKGQDKKDKAPHYRLVNYERCHLREIYQRIVNEGIIFDTSANDFVYYFTGKGKQPIGKLSNKGDLIYLAVLLKECLLSEYEKNEWLTTVAIFDNVKYDSIKNKYSLYNSAYSAPNRSKLSVEKQKRGEKYEEVLNRLNDILRDIPTL